MSEIELKIACPTNKISDALEGYFLISIILDKMLFKLIVNHLAFLQEIKPHKEKEILHSDGLI